MQLELSDVESVSLLLFYDAETVSIDDDGINSEYTIQLSDDTEWSATVILTWIDTKIEPNQRLVSIPVVWSDADTVISDVTVTFDDWTFEPLRIELP